MRDTQEAPAWPAGVFGVSRPSYCQWEGGKQRPHPAAVKLLLSMIP
jgi:DNA-binding transcriptional regulator YiaG